MDRNSVLFSKIYGCLLGGIVGDAMGAPAEDMTYDEVKEKFGYINDFEGAGTDDSAIKLILCEAIIKSEGHVTADEFADAFLANKKKYYHLFYIPVRNMFHKIESKLTLPVYAGLGNMHSSSSAMSIAPMGIINACNPRQAALETYDVAGLIHGGDSTFCRDGACVIAAAVAEAMRPGATIDSIVEASYSYLHKDSSAELLDRIHRTLKMVKDTGSYEKFREEYYKTSLGDIVSDSRETVPRVLALFILSGADAVTAIEYAANFGRDADTIGTMVGAICGAFHGISSLKKDWIDRIEDSYGKTQISSLKNAVTEAKMPDQRDLAEALARIMQKKADEKKKCLAALDSLMA
ncbi:MAG: ADP-ribosylglycohydrolase family protein [Oscillospiraceae bacterium]|jgi:ADP-ribosylglycohydrolase|nr:ADP-ribosylglycohydrolase family protein [Oscillospiraceae bacterium]